MRRTILALDDRSPQKRTIAAHPPRNPVEIALALADAPVAVDIRTADVEWGGAAEELLTNH
jgi:hypothetical protein